jgi:hypothetical protein
MEKYSKEFLKSINDRVLFCGFLFVLFTAANLRNTKEFKENKVLIPTAFGSLVGVLAVLANPEEKKIS